MAVEEKDWLRLQKKIFTRFVNQKLRSRKLECKDVLEDFKDGVLLINFIEVMSGKTFGKIPAHSTQQIQMLDNCSKALEFAKNCNIQVKTIQPSDIVQSNDKYLLGFVFSVIRKYLKFDDEDDSTGEMDAKDALLLWLNNKTQGYANIKIENFTKSFQDGMVFCALLHRYRTRFIPYDTLSPANKIDNIKLAFDVGEKYAGIERYLEVTDIAKLDETGMIVFLNDWYFAISRLQKQDVAARRIGKLITYTQINDSMKSEFNQRASALSKWVDDKSKVLSDLTWDNTLAGIQKKQADFYDYKATEKNAKITERIDIDHLFNTLALRLRIGKRPEFKPPITTANLLAKFEDLGVVEDKRNLAMQVELQRQVRLDKLAKRFATENGKILAWIAEKENYLKKKEEVVSIPTAQMHLTILDAYNSEFSSVKNTRLASLKELGNDIVSDNYNKSNDIKNAMNNLDNQFNNLSKLAGDKKSVLDADLAREKEKERLRLEFAQHAADFTRYVKDVCDRLESAYFGEDLDSVVEHKAILDKEVSTITSDGSSKKKGYEDVQSNLVKMKVTDNAYTTLSFKDLQDASVKLDTAVKNYKQAYDTELARQTANDALCRDFASKTKSYLDNIHTLVSSISAHEKEIEVAYQDINNALSQIPKFNTLLNTINDLANKIESAQIIHNKHTNITAKDCASVFAQFKVLTEKKKKVVEEEIENKKRSGVDPATLKEIEDNFKYFDKDGKGFLNRKAFRACMQSLGEELTKEAVNKALAEHDINKDNTINSSEFLKFMLKKFGDSDTSDETLTAFQLICFDKPQVTVEQLTFCMKDEWINYLTKECKALNGGLDYVTWVKQVYAR